MRSIAFVNQKGGVGKTTTVATLAASLALKGFRVLVIDLDPQANLTIHLGIDTGLISKSLYELLLDETDCKEVIQKTEILSLKIIPSHINLASAEMELNSRVGRVGVCFFWLRLPALYY